jgi:hypothetical protein
MKGHATVMTALDFCGIYHVVEMPMGENKPIDLLAGKVLIRSLRSVEKNVSRWGLKKVGVGVQRTTSKNFERIHEESSRTRRSGDLIFVHFSASFSSYPS